ncbi:MAG: hypothetical protein M0013_04665, partial [Actinomycetota bacterium]|nr:hypothetical protein [Actinomycetota bacterium]
IAGPHGPAADVQREGLAGRRGMTVAPTPVSVWAPRRVYVPAWRGGGTLVAAVLPELTARRPAEWAWRWVGVPSGTAVQVGRS